jgi:hypothetical protein
MPSRERVSGCSRLQRGFPSIQPGATPYRACRAAIRGCLPAFPPRRLQDAIRAMLSDAEQSQEQQEWDVEEEEVAVATQVEAVATQEVAAATQSNNGAEGGSDLPLDMKSWDDMTVMPRPLCGPPLALTAFGVPCMHPHRRCVPSGPRGGAYALYTLCTNEAHAAGTEIVGLIDACCSLAQPFLCADLPTFSSIGAPLPPFP